MEVFKQIQWNWQDKTCLQRNESQMLELWWFFLNFPDSHNFFQFRVINYKRWHTKVSKRPLNATHSLITFIYCLVIHDCSLQIYSFVWFLCKSVFGGLELRSFRIALIGRTFSPCGRLNSQPSQTGPRKGPNTSSISNVKNTKNEAAAHSNRRGIQDN